MNAFAKVLASTLALIMFAKVAYMYVRFEKQPTNMEAVFIIYLATLSL